MLNVIVIISSGLFLGWLLGSKDTVNLFGSSFNTRKQNFTAETIIAGLFIILGALFQGNGTTATIKDLGTISQPVIAFTVALCAAIIVLLLIRANFHVSTSQAIVGAIIGWSVLTKSVVDYNLIEKIVFAWVLAPLLGIFLGAILFITMRWFTKKSNIHVIKLDTYLRFSLILVIAFAAFGLGANNIGNVIGVFAVFSPDIVVDLGLFTLSGLQILFLLGGISISVGLFNYGRKHVSKSDNEIFSLVPETAIVVYLTLAIVMFLFSSSFLQNIFNNIGIPSIPLVPVSITQITIGSILGIGLVKGTREIDSKTLAGIGLSWITTPLSSGILTYIVLYIIRRTFGFSIKNANQDTASEVIRNTDHSVYINWVFPGIIILGILVLLVFIYLVLRHQKIRLKMEKDMLIQQNQLYMSQKAMNEFEMRTIAMENDNLNIKLQARRKEFMDIALNINEQKTFLEKISNGIDEALNISDPDERSQKLMELSVIIKQRMSFSKEKEEFYVQIEDVHKDFHMKLKTSFPNLTDLEKRLAGLIRLNLSNKEIASLLNISAKSVEIARYRLKKKLMLDKNSNLKNFINNI